MKHTKLYYSLVWIFFFSLLPHIAHSQAVSSKELGDFLKKENWTPVKIYPQTGKDGTSHIIMKDGTGKNFDFYFNKQVQLSPTVLTNIKKVKNIRDSWKNVNNTDEKYYILTSGIRIVLGVSKFLYKGKDLAEVLPSGLLLFYDNKTGDTIYNNTIRDINKRINKVRGKYVSEIEMAEKIFQSAGSSLKNASADLGLDESTNSKSFRELEYHINLLDSYPHSGIWIGSNSWRIGNIAYAQKIVYGLQIIAGSGFVFDRSFGLTIEETGGLRRYAIDLYGRLAWFFKNKNYHPFFFLEGSYLFYKKNIDDSSILFGGGAGILLKEFLFLEGGYHFDLSRKIIFPYIGGGLRIPFKVGN